jgi:hypothetical protein
MRTLSSAALLAAALLAAACTQVPETAAPPEYDPEDHEFAGSQTCQPCHVQAFADWQGSSHATTVRPADYSDVELVESFIECGDLFFSHVLGDRHHVRFLVEDAERPPGQGRWLALPCGWDVHEKEVTLHHPGRWRDLPWESGCAGCHVTGFRADDHGFLELGVGCEECHGPSKRHLTEPVPGTSLSFKDSSAAEEVSVCASCHLQGGRSRSTGLKLPPHYLAGGLLFDDYEFDWSELDADGGDKVLDLHQKINVHAVVVEGDDGLRCTSCHALHAMTDEKHRELPRQDYCLLCHQDTSDYALKEYSQSCNVCEF